VNSCSIAARQLGSFRASRTDVGVGDKVGEVPVRAYLGLGLTMPARARVVIGCGTADAAAVGEVDGVVAGAVGVEDEVPGAEAEGEGGAEGVGAGLGDAGADVGLGEAWCGAGGAAGTGS
jgi:hypothetical protein